MTDQKMEFLQEECEWQSQEQEYIEANSPKALPPKKQKPLEVKYDFDGQ